MPALGAMTCLGFSGYALLLPVAPLWAVHGGAGTTGAGLVNGVLLLATVLTQLGVPAMLRRLGWGPVTAGGLVLLGGGSLLHVAGDALPVVLAASAVRGVGFGMLTVTGSAAAGLLVPPARRGAAIGGYGLAVAVPNLVLLPLGPTIVDLWGFPPAFVVAALPLLGVPFALALAHHLRPEDEEETETGRPTRSLLAPAGVLLAVTLAGGAVLTFAPQLVDQAVVASGGLALLGLTAALSRWLVGGLADRHGPHPFLPPLVLTTVAGMAAIALAVREPALPGVSLVVFLAGCAVLGASYGALQNLTLVASFAAVPRRDTHTASAVWNIGFDAGTATGSVLVGALAAGTGFPTALLFAGLLSLLTLPLTRRPAR
jgi:predicted MFS family arabinose efflux permease